MSAGRALGPAFPFSALVAADELRLARVLAAVDPGIGGVLLRGEKGSAKTTAARGLAALLAGGAPFVELPLGATEDRVVGSFDVRAALGEGEYRYRPGLLEAATAERYRLETSMWIGATLKQGVWYQMSAPLSLPGLQRYVVEQHITFAFTSRVPCAAGEAARRCIEIVLHVTPEKKELSPLLADIRYLLTGIGPRYFGRQFFHYDASITARIVIDPATLLPYSREERIDWYASAGTHKADSILQADHLIATTRYGTRRARPQTPAAQSAHAASPLTPRESVPPGDSAVDR